jgi:hypothetical protein
MWGNGEDLEGVYVNNWRQTRPHLHNYLIFETVSANEEIILSKLVGKTAVITGGSSGIGRLQQSFSYPKARMYTSLAAGKKNSMWQ